MPTGVVLLNFGEPSEPERAAVVEYLERIFLANADLEDAADPRQRARDLAERRAPTLIDEYETIGGSPLAEQAATQAEALERHLQDEGYAARTYTGMQYTAPFIDDAVEAAIADGANRLIGLPVYPLCGPSTTVAALQTLTDAVDGRVPVQEVTGWHRHPGYTRLRADNIAQFGADRDIDLTSPDTSLVFSAHGTPIHYLEDGSRYDVYVEEYSSVQASLLGLDDYAVGYQNHENRDIPWTEPTVEDVLAGLDADRVVIEPVSFLHEQSETLYELDVDVREVAETAGITFHRVPIPHNDERLSDIFADLLEPFLADFDPSYYQLRQCQCRDRPGTVCLNAPRGG